LQTRLKLRCRGLADSAEVQPRYDPEGSGTALQQHVTDVTDGPGRVQTLGTYVHAVHDATATEHTERIVHGRQALFGHRVTAVSQETIGLQQRGRAEELVRVPPEGRATGRAARAQNAFVQTVQLLALFRSLQTFDGRSRRIVLQVRLHHLVLL